MGGETVRIGDLQEFLKGMSEEVEPTHQRTSLSTNDEIAKRRDGWDMEGLRVLFLPTPRAQVPVMPTFSR